MQTVLGADKSGTSSVALPISLYISSLQTGGAENMMVKLANYFARRGHLTTLIVNTKGGLFERKLINSFAAGYKMAR